MTRIESKFLELKKRGEKALITFITAGDPNLEVTERLVDALEKSGADLIELGVPFSDPMADGPVIQHSSERALQAGVRPVQILELVRVLRKKTKIPIILMGYYNPILQMGCEKFCKQASQAGVDGLIVVDLPPEESAELQIYTKKFGIDLIFLLTPTADTARIAKIKKLASGFIYYVSVTGITGSKVNTFHSIHSHLAEIKKQIDLPICVGFGIRNPEDAKALSKKSDGVIVGSALVSLLEQHQPEQAVLKISSLVKELKLALK